MILNAFVIVQFESFPCEILHIPTEIYSKATFRGKAELRLRVKVLMEQNKKSSDRHNSYHQSKSDF